MSTPMESVSTFAPKVGDLVRYAGGCTALAVLVKEHAGGWYGRRCMGGVTFLSHPQPPSDEDKRTWVACAEWRDETAAQAAQDIGVSHEAGDVAAAPPAQLRPHRIEARKFVDTPSAMRQSLQPKPAAVLSLPLNARHAEEFTDGAQFILINADRFARMRRETLSYCLVAVVLAGIAGALVARLLFLPAG